MSTAYNQLAQTLRNNIIRGKWKTGHRIEPERELCARYGFSRITVRRALATLEEENLLVRRQGLGTFVNIRTRRKIPIVRGDFARSMLTHSPAGKRILLDRRQMPAGRELALQFGIPPGAPVIVARRLDLMGNHPTAMDEVTLPAQYADQITKDDWQVFDFFERWLRRQGLNPDHESQVIEAVPAADAPMKWLKVKRGHPLLMETNFVYLSGGETAAKFVSYYRYEHYQFNSVDRPLGDARGKFK